MVHYYSWALPRCFSPLVRFPFFKTKKNKNTLIYNRNWTPNLGPKPVPTLTGTQIAAIKSTPPRKRHCLPIRVPGIVVKCKAKFIVQKLESSHKFAQFIATPLQSFTGQWVTPLNGSNQISGLKFEAIILIPFGLCLDISCLL
jgi:hypothetical protein